MPLPQERPTTVLASLNTIPLPLSLKGHWAALVGNHGVGEVRRPLLQLKGHQTHSNFFNLQFRKIPGVVYLCSHVCACVIHRS